MGRSLVLQVATARSGKAGVQFQVCWLPSKVPLFRIHPIINASEADLPGTPQAHFTTHQQDREETKGVPTSLLA